MKIIELVKEVEKINKESKELGFDDATMYIQFVPKYGRTEDIATTRDFKNIMKDLIDEEAEKIKNIDLVKKDKFTYIINEEYHLNLYKERNF